jgi:hypothetical protein
VEQKRPIELFGKNAKKIPNLPANKQITVGEFTVERGPSTAT